MFRIHIDRISPFILLYLVLWGPAAFYVFPPTVIVSEDRIDIIPMSMGNWTGRWQYSTRTIGDRR